MTMTYLFFFMEAVLTESVGQLNLCDTCRLAEPSSCYCSVPLSEPSTCYARAPGKVRCSRRRCACCAGRELVAVVPLSHCVEPGRDRIGNPPYHTSCLPVGPAPGKGGFSSSYQSPSHTP